MCLPSLAPIQLGKFHLSSFQPFFRCAFQVFILKYFVDGLADCGNEHAKGKLADSELDFMDGIRFSNSKEPQGNCKTLR